MCTCLRVLSDLCLELEAGGEWQWGLQVRSKWKCAGTQGEVLRGKSLSQTHFSLSQYFLESTLPVSESHTPVQNVTQRSNLSPWNILCEDWERKTTHSMEQSWNSMVSVKKNLCIFPLRLREPSVFFTFSFACLTSFTYFNYHFFFSFSFPSLKIYSPIFYIPLEY